MSATGRFAPMTSALLARKGEASPADASAMDAFLLDRRDVILERPSVPLPKEVVRPRALREFPSHELPEMPRFANDKPLVRRRHSISLSLSDSEFEKLGLVAVKKRINRQQLLRLAIDHYLEGLACAYGAECRCISACGSCSESRA